MRLLAPCLPLAALAACSFGVGIRTPTLSPETAAAQGFRQVPRPVELPRSPQTADCGPEALSAVITSWGRPASVEELSRLLRNPLQKEGVVTPELLPVARQKGLKVTLVHGSVGRIRQAVDRGVAPIIVVDAGGGLFHFFVVTGYSDLKQRILCADFGASQRQIDYEEVERRWEPAGNVMLELEPATAQADFDTGVNLENEGRYAEAVVYYRRALRADPGHFDARLGLGTCLLHLKKFEEALAEYTRAHAADPDDPRLCGNMAHLLLELKRDPPRAERLSGHAVETLGRRLSAAQEARDRETRPDLRKLRQREVDATELTLAYALGTLGQARAANGKHAEARAAFQASHDHFPLTEFDARAKRQYELGLSCRALQMPAEARLHFMRALREAKDPALRGLIEKALQEP